MLKKVTITNYLGEKVEYKIEGVDVNANNGLLITKIDGLGPVKANINMTKYATADNDTYNSARLGGRNIVINARFTNCPTIEEARLSSYKFFPIKKKVTFKIETDNRIAETTGYVESNEPNIFSKESDMQISIVCESAFFLSPNEDVTIFSGVDPLFEFPFENNTVNEMQWVELIEFGAIINKKTAVVPYSGDSQVGCIITLHAIGTVANVTIYNMLTRERMKIDTAKLASLTGNGIIAGDTITICTITGKKSINLLRGGENINILNVLGKNVDWLTLTKGDNVFGFIADDGEENVQLKVSSQVSYEGV